MRPLKILSLLFSLAQFILVLKLIELVRGNPAESLQISQEEEIDPQERSFFLAPSKAKLKKYKLWGTTTTETPTTDLNFPRDGLEEVEYQFDRMGVIIPENSTSFKKENFTNVEKQSETSEDDEGRLCPGCESGVCGGSLVSYAFPIVPVIIAIIVGIIWFFIFLFLWYFASAKPIGGVDSIAASPGTSGGYGYGSSSDASSSGGIGSILDFFQGGGGNGQQRSWDSFNRLTHIIIDAVTNLAKMYDS